MRKPRVVTIDFETLGIEQRPAYPPAPVGVAIKYPGKAPRYYAFGHRGGNTCSWGEARAALATAYAWGDGLAGQNLKFDLDVAETHLGLPLPPWERLHDTMFLLFLSDPHQRELSLKPAAERLLGLPPTERDAVADWLLANQPVPGVRVSASRASPHFYGRYLGHAPGDLVGRYGSSDVVMTEGLFNLLWPQIRDRGMLSAYDRERRLLPILLRMERAGLRVALERLLVDVGAYTSWQERLDAWLRRALRAGPELNLDSGEQLADALLAAGKLDLTRASRTATGKLSTSKEALPQALTDPRLVSLLRYRAALKTTLGTFTGPWLRLASATGGTIHTTWHQVRGAKGNDTAGTRTGRLSATWFMNMPKEFTDVRPPARELPRALAELPPLPNCRSYIIPGQGRCFIDRDWSQQEPRLLAHFEGGALMQQYRANPWLDLHDNARDELAKVGKIYERRPVKNTNLGLIYGMGVGLLAERNNMAVTEAKGLRDAILAMYPGLKAMYSDMRERARTNTPIRTWGGREIYCEPPQVVDGKLREYDYKLVNLLIQGSGADVNKEAVIRWEAQRSADWPLVLDVHDQLTASVSTRDARDAMQLLKEVMEGIELDVPLLSEGAVSYTDWGHLIEVDKRGKELPWPSSNPSAR